MTGSIVAVLEQRVALHPQACAVDAGARQLTYAELGERAQRLARHLRRCGVAAGSVVALALDDPVGLIIGMAGTLMAGGLYVAVDRDLPDSRIVQLVHDCAPAVMIVRAGDEPPIGAQTVAHVVALDDRGVPAGAGGATTAALPQLSGDDLACVFFTSGTTGRPKGVPLRHRGVTRLFAGDPPMDLVPGARMAQVAYPMFDASTLEIWAPLLQGATVVPIPRATLLDAARLREALRAGRIDTLFLTTAVFRQVAVRAPDAFAGLDTVYVGGEALDVAPVRAVMKAGPPRRLRNLYGPTETTTLASWYDLAEIDGDAVVVPIGTAVPRTRLYVLGADLRPVPDGQIGELFVAGDGLGPGYLHRPGLTATRYLPEPEGEAGDRAYRTGDLVARRSDGTLLFHGRADRQVKINGFRIELQEIEAVLGACPGVAGCAVEVTDSPDGHRLLTAYLSAPELTEDDIRTYARARLPAYLVPNHLVLVGSLRLTAGGKVDRAALTRQEPLNPGQSLSPTEKAVAALWAQVLGVSAVDHQRNFFDLGGTSFLLMELQAAMTDELGRAPAIADLLAHGTVAQQAALLDGRQPDCDPAPAEAPQRARQRLHLRRGSLHEGTVDDE